MREGTSATALLCRSGDGACARVQIEATDGELSRSRLALAIVERLRPLELPAAPPTKPLAARAVPAPAAPPPRQPATAPRERPLRAWLGGGLLLSSGLSTPMGWLSSSLDVSASAPWGFEVALAGAPLAGRAQTYAGSLSVRGLQAAAFATFEPLRRQVWGFDLGLGGGVLHVWERATPAPGFDGFSEATTVGMVSARARVYRRFGSVYWGVAVDPGMLVPAVSVEAGADRLLRIGRPWLALQTSLGVDL
jgi:hypothetical protein